jgi:hypothetical protein
MPKFDLTIQGKTYEVDSPDEQSLGKIAQSIAKQEEILQKSAKKTYKSIIPENLTAPIQAIKEQVAQRILSPTMPIGPGVVPTQALPEAQRGLEIGALQAANLGAVPFAPGLPQMALRSIGYEIPQAKSPRFNVKSGGYQLIP